MEKDSALLEELRVLLADSLSEEAVDVWLTSANRYLGGERPVDLLDTDQYNRVLEAAQAFTEGTYL
jgi:hypothetical protein